MLTVAMEVMKLVALDFDKVSRHHLQWSDKTGEEFKKHRRQTY